MLMKGKAYIGLIQKLESKKDNHCGMQKQSGGKNWGIVQWKEAKHSPELPQQWHSNGDKIKSMRKQLWEAEPFNDVLYDGIVVPSCTDPLWDRPECDKRDSPEVIRVENPERKINRIKNNNAKRWVI